MLFENERSVPYIDESIEAAISQIETFDADLGGTNIFSPLDFIYKKKRAYKEIQETHIVLLTDGAIWDTDKVVNLVKKNSSLSQRLQTIGVGQGVSEDLVKRCAMSGFGSFYFVNDA